MFSLCNINGYNDLAVAAIQDDYNFKTAQTRKKF